MKDKSAKQETQPEATPNPGDGGIPLDETDPEVTELIEELVDGNDPYTDETEGQHPWLDFDPANAEATKKFEVTPHSILEAMLFVGTANGEPLEPKRVASLMRGVRENEIADFIEELNQGYARDETPYRIVTEKGGFKMQLDASFAPIRNRFYSEQKDVDLSQRAIDALSLVAYKQPISRQEIEELRGRNCSSVLSQLVRRKLLQIERTDEKPRRTLYRTTERFLKLFEIESIEDLPSSQQPEFTD